MGISSSPLKRQGGYSMLEGLTILLMISIALAAGTPSLQGMLGRSQASADVRNLISALNLARTHAITQNTVTILCASSDGRQCGGRWNSGTLLFRDENNNRRLDGEDRLIERGPKLDERVRLDWRASAGRNDYIRFSRHGMAMEFGSFTYCAPHLGPSSGYRLVLNRMGRIRVERELRDAGANSICRGGD